MNESVTGYIDHVIFRNEENGYTVMILKGVDGEEEMTCVGTFPVLTMGASVELTGSYIQHPVYGKQFQVSVLTEKMPEDAMAMERYLGSGPSKELVQHWQPGLSSGLEKTPCILWKKNRNVLQKLRESVKKRRERSRCRLLRRQICAKQ